MYSSGDTRLQFSMSRIAFRFSPCSLILTPVIQSSLTTTITTSATTAPALPAATTDACTALSAVVCVTKTAVSAALQAPVRTNIRLAVTPGSYYYEAAATTPPLGLVHPHEHRCSKRMGLDGTSQTNKATPTSSTSASVAAATALTPAPYSYAAGATATPPTLGLVKLEQKSGDQYMSSDGTPQRFSYLFSESSAASAPITAQVTGTPEHDNYNYYEEYDYRVSLINFSPSIRYNIICMCM